MRVKIAISARDNEIVSKKKRILVEDDEVFFPTVKSDCQVSHKMVWYRIYSFLNLVFGAFNIVVRLLIVFSVTTLFLTGGEANAEAVMMLFTTNTTQVADYIDIYKYNEQDWMQTTQADFNNGILTNVDSADIPGSLVLADGAPLDDWWDVDWDYRQRFDVENSSSSILENYQLKFEIDSSYSDFWSNVTSDGRDVRVVDEEGDVWDYWVENWDYASQSAVIWAKLDSIQVGEVYKTYLYYGNSLAVDAQSFDNTFTKDQDVDEPYNDADLAAEWHMDEGSGNTQSADDAGSNDASFLNNKDLRIESGTAFVWSGFRTIPLDNTYDNPVVVASFEDYSNTSSLVVRVDNVTSTSFDIGIQDQSGGFPFAIEMLNYVVMEEGAYFMEDGTKIEAGMINSNDEYERSSANSFNSWIDQDFRHEYSSSPVVVSQVMNYHSSPTSMLVTRTQDIDNESFEIILQNDEGNNVLLKEHQIGWIAAENTYGAIGGFDYEFGATPDVVTHTSYTQNFSASFGSTPIVIAHIATTDGPDPAYIRSDNASAGSVDFAIQEDTNNDTETNHTTESIHYLTFENSFDSSTPQDISWGGSDGGHWGDVTSQLFSVGSFLDLMVTDSYLEVSDSVDVDVSGDLTIEAWVRPEVNDTPKMEVGQVSVDENWAEVTFANLYKNPIVATFSSNTNNSDSPFSTRIQNLDSNSFEVRLQGPPDNYAPCEGGACASLDFDSEDVSYLVIEEGVWNLDGTLIQAGQIDTSMVSHGNVGSGNSWTGENINFAESFNQDPLVLHQVLTNNDSNWISSWVSAQSGRGSPPTNNGMQVSLNGAEVTDSHGEETIGWIAVEPNKAGKVGNTVFETQLTGNDVLGYANGCYNYDFNNDYAANPIVIGAQETMNGGNGSWLMQCGISSTQVGIHVDEDQTSNSERNHIEETAGFMVFASGDSTGMNWILQKQGAYGLELINNKIVGWVNGEAGVGGQFIPNAWNHVVMTYDQSNLELYLDGAVQDSMAYASAISTNANDLYMGENLRGDIDEFKLYSKSFDGGEVAAHYERRKYIDPSPTITQFGGQQDQLSGYESSGIYESQTLDTVDNRSWYGYLNWDSNVPAVTDLQFQIASNNNNATWNFVGPDGTNATYYTTPDQLISRSHLEDRYLRVRAYLTTSDNTETPVLDEVQLNYADTSLVGPSDVLTIDGNISGNYTHPIYRIETSNPSLNNSLLSVHTNQSTLNNVQNFELLANDTSSQIVAVNELVTQSEGADIVFDSANDLFLSMDEDMINSGESTTLDYYMEINVGGVVSSVIILNFSLNIDT